MQGERRRNARESAQVDMRCDRESREKVSFLREGGGGVVLMGWHGWEGMTEAY